MIENDEVTSSEPEDSNAKVRAFDNPNPAFHLGCYMALGEEIHQRAHGGSDAMTSAVASVCETPRKSLPRVILKIRNALQKMQRTDDRAFLQKLTKGLSLSFHKFASVWANDASYPPHLSDNDQLQFWSGYHHQSYLILQWVREKNQKESS